MRKKLWLLSIGAVASIATPVAIVVACGSHADSTTPPVHSKHPAAKANPSSGADVKLAPSVDELKSAPAEKLIGGLSSQGTTLTHFLIVVGKDAKGFDVRTAFELRGSAADYTNRLVLDATDKGEHDYLIAPGFDASKIHLGDVITEELNTDDVVTTSDSHGKTFNYGLVSNAELSFQA